MQEQQDSTLSYRLRACRPAQ